MQEENPLPEPPQRSRPKLVAAGAALRDVVRKAAAHVVNLKIRVGLNRDIAQRGRNVGGLSGANGRSVAGRTAYLLEQRKAV